MRLPRLLPESGSTERSGVLLDRTLLRAALRKGLPMRICRYALFAVVALGIAVLMPLGFLCLKIDHYGRHDLAQPADAIVVLGAIVLPDGQPGPDLTTRTEHAVTLYERGLAPRLICAGGIRQDPVSAASVCRSIATALNVPEEAVLAADGSANTEQDAHEVASVMGEHGWATAIVVSHPLHVYRAKLFFEKEGLTVYTSPTSTDVDGIAFPLRTYYTMREAVGILWPYVEEAGFPPGWTAILHRWVYTGP